MALLSCALGYGEDQAPAPSEYQVKAAFLYNFVKFVEWPSSAESQAGPIALCVIGKDPFRGELHRAVDGKAVNGRPLIVRQTSDASATQSCQVLFVSLSEEGRAAGIIAAVAGWSVLTVSDIDWFSERGGMINFIMQGQRVRFQINPDAAARAGLRISSKLLHLGVTPEEKKRN